MRYLMEESNSIKQPEMQNALAAVNGKRSGKTRAHYLTQKSHQYALFCINKNELEKLDSFQFSLYDFIKASFAFKENKKTLSVAVLEELRKQPKTFAELVNALKVPRGTLFLTCLALERSGMIKRDGKRKPYSIDYTFTVILKKYAEWWERWVKTK